MPTVKARAFLALRTIVFSVSLSASPRACLARASEIASPVARGRPGRRSCLCSGGSSAATARPCARPSETDQLPSRGPVGASEKRSETESAVYRAPQWCLGTFQNRRFEGSAMAAAPPLLALTPRSASQGYCR